MMNLIVGLGNPGPRYEATRHNAGQLVISLLCRELGVDLKDSRFQSSSAVTRLEGTKTILLCPTTYMNLSGTSVKSCVDYYKIDPDNILIIHDDLDMPLGRVKVIRDGGAGGHNGIRSVINCLGTTQFARIKTGIGRPRYGEPVEEYVLSSFYSDEKDAREEAIHLAAQACRLITSKGIESAMNQTNCQQLNDLLGG